MRNYASLLVLAATMKPIDWIFLFEVFAVGDKFLAFLARTTHSKR
jgi:hypothetical protein